MKRIGVGIRLSLVLLVLTAAALTAVYLAVVPTLETRLVDDKVEQLEGLTEVVAETYQEEPFVSASVLAQAIPGVNARVVIYAELGGRLTVFDDSAGLLGSAEMEGDRIAQRAFVGQEPASGTLERRETRFAEAARPVFVPESRVVLLSSSLTGEVRDIQLVERRLLIAGLLALMGAVALGFGAATLHARRIRRLEQAAERIAGGQFDEPVVDTGSDELRELADAFERMRQRLAALDHARREFVANASHELRTPIFALGAALELLEDEELDEATRLEFMNTMHEQVERLSRLAEDLLDLSRLDAGRVSVEASPVDLGAAADALAAEFEAAALAAKHPLSVERNGVAVALADGDQVLRIGRALVENALRHTPEGTGVCIRAERRNGFAVLEVEDDGPGIPPEHLDQVFDRFYRVDGTRASGSGLGLAIARELAELMDGSLEAANDGAATRFVLALPRHRT